MIREKEAHSTSNRESRTSLGSPRVSGAWCCSPHCDGPTASAMATARTRRARAIADLSVGGSDAVSFESAMSNELSACALSRLRRASSEPSRAFSGGGRTDHRRGDVP